MAMTDETVWGEIDGRTITFPMVVPDANIATALFTVPAAAAASLLPGEDFVIVESAPGATQCIVAACDYRSNPWGDYDEINLGFLAAPKAAPDQVGSFVYRMPVNQAFTCEAGNRVMGFPKTVEQIDVDYGEDEVTFALAMGGEPTLRLTVPRAQPAGPAAAPVRIAAVSFSYLDGVAYGTTLEMDMGEPVDPAAVRLELGTGAVADELRTLGLPTVADFASWGEGLGAVFHIGQPV